MGYQSTHRCLHNAHASQKNYLLANGVEHEPLYHLAIKKLCTPKYKMKQGVVDLIVFVLALISNWCCL